MVPPSSVTTGFFQLRIVLISKYEYAKLPLVSSPMYPLVGSGERESDCNRWGKFCPPSLICTNGTCVCLLCSHAGSTKVEYITAFAGITTLSAAESNSVKVSVKRLVLHPAYNPLLLDFDVAVLELAQPLPFGRYIQPVCLPLAIHKFPVGKKCVISGWGSIREGNSRWRPVAIRAPNGTHDSGGGV